MGTSPSSTSSSFGAHREASNSGQTTCSFTTATFLHVQERRQCVYAAFGCTLNCLGQVVLLIVFDCGFASGLFFAVFAVGVTVGCMKR